MQGAGGAASLQEDELLQQFQACLDIGRLSTCLQIAQQACSESCWQQLADAAMQSLIVDLAIRYWFEGWIIVDWDLKWTWVELRPQVPRSFKCPLEVPVARIDECGLA